MKIAIDDFGVRFGKLANSEYIKKYRKEVRPLVEWSQMSSLKPGMQVITSRDELANVYTVWTDKTWTHGKKKTVKESLKKEGKEVAAIDSNDLIIIRVAGVKKKNKIMLLDGNHRAVGLYKGKGSFVLIIDTLEVPSKFRGVLDIAFGQL